MRSNLAGTEVTDIPCDRMEGGMRQYSREEVTADHMGGTNNYPKIV
jgi:hypothetical protein